MRRFVLPMVVLCFVLAIPAWADAALITFDTDASGARLKAPPVFVRTSPLRHLYGQLGVHFQGSKRGVGGAILNERAGFGIPAKSGVNFLAFNRSRTYARDPETVTFTSPQHVVSIWAGDCGGCTPLFTMRAFLGPDRVDGAIVSPPGGEAIRGVFDPVR